MNVYEKIIEIGKSFKNNTFIIYQINGNTGHIIDVVADRAEAMEYQRIAKKNGLRAEIAEYDTAENAVYYF